MSVLLRNLLNQSYVENEHPLLLFRKVNLQGETIECLRGLVIWKRQNKGKMGLVTMRVCYCSI